MNPMWLMRMAKWVRRPPSRKQLITMLVVALIAGAIALIDHAGLWPDWARMDRPPRGL